ncbi:hypothetical protein [Halobacteriovorax sp. HLS]|uniref:hypothetical protein n=1 Tax=Halobacteriovorax sp. HLS TaxID=2234000 RepID=UPI000FDCCD97|nr:hypothetical protein [Halobacteriovorax sp. HLS]
MKYIKDILILTLLVFNASSFAIEDKDIVNLAKRSLEQVNTTFRYTCGAELKESSECPYMVGQFRIDTNTGLFFQMISDSPWDSCKRTIPSSKYISVKELEEKFSKTQGRDLGITENYFTGKINECFDRRDKSEEEVSIQKKAIVSMSYNYLNKIKDNTHQLSQEIANINSILGTEIKKDLPCDEFNMPHDSSYCRSIEANKCQAQGGVNNLSDDIFTNAIEPIYAIALKIKEVRRNYSGRGYAQIKNKKINELKSMVEFIKAENPILHGNILSDYIDDDIIDDRIKPTKSDLLSKVKQQFLENKKILNEKLRRNIRMNDCILYGDSGQCDDFEEDLASIPYQSSAMAFSRDEIANPNSRLKQLAREELYQLPECIDRTRNLKNEFNDFALNTSLNVGLTVLTGGAGLVLRAGQLGKMAMTATKVGTLGVDTAFLGKGAYEAIDKCDEELNGMEKIGDSKQENICPTGVKSAEYIRTSNIRGCVTAALLTSIDALPFVPAIAAKGVKMSQAAKQTERELAHLRKDPQVKEVKESFESLEIDLKVTGCGRYNKKNCSSFVESNRDRLTSMHKKCLNKKIATVYNKTCTDLEVFLNEHEVLRLSDMIPKDKQGKSVVVEFNSGRGHITLRYFKEVVDENGQKVMKAFSYDGTSWLLPRRVNEKMLSKSKNADSFDSLDKVVPGSHYVLDISPKQVEMIHDVAKKGGFSKACTHDARVALDEAGVLSMPKGMGSAFDKITIKQLANDLTSKYGKPKHSTIKSLEESLDPSKAGFSDEQWKTFAVTEYGWAVLTPVTVGVVYPTAVASTAMITVTIVDSDGRMFNLTQQKYRELVDELKSL